MGLFNSMLKMFSSQRMGLNSDDSVATPEIVSSPLNRIPEDMDMALASSSSVAVSTSNACSSAMTLASSSLSSNLTSEVIVNATSNLSLTDSINSNLNTSKLYSFSALALRPFTFGLVSYGNIEAAENHGNDSNGHYSENNGVNDLHTLSNHTTDDNDDHNNNNSVISAAVAVTPNSNIDHHRSDISDSPLSMSKSVFLCPSKRRQGRDVTADIETTVMAMDIDKDSYRIPTAETCDGNSTNTTVLDDTAYPLVRNNRMFDIPEIIRSIAEFLDKPSLAASCRVSRLWATHCKPLLWRHVVDKHWRYSKFYASIRTQAHFIRTIKCEDKTDYQELLLCDLPRLKSISFHGSREVMQIRDKLLDRVSKTLTSLVMSSVADRLPEETVIAVRNLRHLTTLKLMNVDLNRNQLGEILRDCRCLDFLSLSRVKLLATSDSNLVTFEDEDASLIIAGNVSNDTNLYDSDDEGLILSSLQAEQTTAVTRVRYLALKEITVPLKYLIRLIRSCPELLELSLARNESMPLTADLTQTLKISCPRLYALDVGSCKQIDRETFISLFTSLTQLRVINLSGTRVADDELFVLAENCKNITRLDIQYCTSITSSGLHRFLSHCGTSLRHLEASGVTIDPTSFDRQYHWTCTKLQTLFVHVGLVGSTIPNKVPLSAISDSQNTSSAAIASTIEPAIPGIGSDSLSSPSTTPTEDVIGADKKRPQDAVSLPSRYLEDSSGSGSRDSFSTLNNNSAAITSPLSTNINADSDGDVVMDHPLHPIQDVCNVQYLGLMGCGPKLTCQTTSQNQLIRGFRSVKRLHVLGLYQSFKKEDLEWLVENLPELCRIDAEKYNVSDELLKWFEEVYPHVQICRHD